MRLCDLIGIKLQKAVMRTATAGAGLTVALCFFGRTVEAIAAFAVTGAIIILLLLIKAASAHIKIRRQDNAENLLYKQNRHEVIRGVRL